MSAGAPQAAFWTRGEGLLTVDGIVATIARDNIVLDPGSLIVSRGVVIGTGNLFHAAVCLLAISPGELRIGDGNVFETGTKVEARDGGIVIGDRNQLGEGVVTIKASRAGARIVVEDDTRLVGVIGVYGATRLGGGSQILGTITAVDCVLEPGGSHAEPDPDGRGGLLKGHGTARGLVVPQGGVIVGNGNFDAADLVTQSTFHPKATRP